MTTYPRQFPSAAEDLEALEDASASLMVVVTGMHRLGSIAGRAELATQPARRQGATVELRIIEALLAATSEHVKRCHDLLAGEVHDPGHPGGPESDGRHH
jgi:hypothetical protein